LFAKVALRNGRFFNFIGGRFMVRKNNIRLARTLRRMSQYELARKTGIFQTRISLFENEYATPKPEELKKMSLALGITDPQELWSSTPVEG
jgi:transcriptional regulator with XRE-family HTH domain